MSACRNMRKKGAGTMADRPVIFNRRFVMLARSRGRGDGDAPPSGTICVETQLQTASPLTASRETSVDFLSFFPNNDHVRLDISKQD